MSDSIIGPCHPPERSPDRPHTDRNIKTQRGGQERRTQLDPHPSVWRTHSTRGSIVQCSYCRPACVFVASCVIVAVPQACIHTIFLHCGAGGVTLKPTCSTTSFAVMIKDHNTKCVYTGVPRTITDMSYAPQGCFGMTTMLAQAFRSAVP